VSGKGNIAATKVDQHGDFYNCPWTNRAMESGKHRMSLKLVEGRATKSCSFCKRGRGRAADFGRPNERVSAVSCLPADQATPKDLGKTSNGDLRIYPKIAWFEQIIQLKALDFFFSLATWICLLLLHCQAILRETFFATAFSWQLVSMRAIAASAWRVIIIK
jgi:hypothetical protein